jgi:UDP-2,4-diacetamido-2,4,6-trideoxy-beta-L-altropyranose hydrolase
MALRASCGSSRALPQGPSVNSGVCLRRAKLEDAYALWLWANDPGTRANSFTREPIAWDAHVSWLDRWLTDEAKIILVAESRGAQPIGCVRFDSSDGWQSARLSYVIAPESRGHRLAAPIISAALPMLATAGSGVVVTAEVLEGNESSARVFRSLGWQERSGGNGSLRFVGVIGAPK